MTMVIGNWINGGPAEMARLELPSGPAGITQEEYRASRQYLHWDRRLFGGGPTDASTEDVLAYAAKRLLAEDLGVLVGDEELGQYLQLQLRMLNVDYEQIWRGYFGFRNPLDYEAMLRKILQVRALESLLASTVIPTGADVLDQWAKDYEEVQYEFVILDADSFFAEASALEPDEQELQNFFESDMNFSQRRELELEEAVTFRALVLSSASLRTEAVTAWAPSDPPEEDALQGYYDFHRFTLYARPPEDPRVETEPFLTREEVTEERLLRDYLLNRAALTLRAAATDAGDLAAFATERGVEYLLYEELIPSSELTELERIGHDRLRELAFSELDTFLPEPLIFEGLAILALPTSQRARTMPELAEVREFVVDFWRISQQLELARTTAQSILDEIRGDGDGPPLQAAEAFANTAATHNLPVMTQDWVSRRVRPVADPRWDPEDRIRPWLRNQIGNLLDDSLDNQVVGPLENPGERSVILGHLLGRRRADTARIWPGELPRARNAARNSANQRFREEGLSYEGMARAYRIEKLETEEDV